MQFCASLMHKRANSEAMMVFVRLLASPAARRRFLKNRALGRELLALEREERNYVESVGIYEARGDLVEAATMLADMGRRGAAAERLLRHARWAGRALLGLAPLVSVGAAVGLIQCFLAQIIAIVLFMCVPAC